MASYTIENEKLALTVDSHGAEMKSLIRKSDGREMLWQADPAYWGRTSPVLFPVVGCYFEKTSIYDGKAYQMGQHGFARDMDFVLESESETEIWFSLTDSEESLEKYPFAFRLLLGYRLSGELVKVLWKVENTDSRKMYFSIGGHPAFRCDLNHSTVCLKKNGVGQDDGMEVKVIEGDSSGCLSQRVKTINLKKGVMRLFEEVFDDDALIFEDRQADSVTLSEREQELLTVAFDAPLFGLWSPAKKQAPFVCIEPWYGRCDRVGFSKKLEDREYGNALEPGAVFEAAYDITVHGA